MLSTAMRDRLRDQIERSHTASVAVQRASRSRDSEGDATISWTTIATVTGRIGNGQQRFPTETVTAEQLTGQMAWSVALPAGTDVTNEDRLVADGVTYEVVGVLSPMSHELERRCVCVVVG